MMSFLNVGTTWIDLFSWHFCCSWSFLACHNTRRGLWKLHLLASVDVVIVLDPLSGSFSWQLQMVLPDYRTAPPPLHAAAVHHAITVGNGIIKLIVMKSFTEDQNSVGRQYSPSPLYCILRSECSSIWSWGMFVIYFCIHMIWLISTENVQEKNVIMKKVIMYLFCVYCILWL